MTIPVNISDFILRSEQNLKVVQNRVEEEKDTSHERKTAFEITQLINSLLGLIVLPQQHLIDSMPNTSFDELRNEGWPEAFLKLSSRSDLGEDLNSLMKCMRNGITHFNIKLTGEDGIISSIEIKDRESNEDPFHWEVSLKPNDLRVIVLKFGEIVKNLPESHFRQT